ncbi:MAG: cyclic nucleotide-binding domain-containing protein [Dehalococcoidia bacterium]|nr:cyclic nucleotide-binding domain-containing protein [Dehalococcoidia bacterium]
MGNCMFVVLAGLLSVVREESGSDVVIGDLEGGEIFGEMAILDHGHRSATVRAKGNARVLALDKQAFLKRVREDPHLALRILEQMSGRIRHLDDELSRALGQQRD